MTISDALAEAESVEPLVDGLFRGPLTSGGYEPREHQIRMAQMAARVADRESGWSFVEAPTGSGKGAAYLVPGILAQQVALRKWNEHHEEHEPRPKLVVSTANIALQQQLVKKDIPAILSALGLGHMRSVLLKGRNNYLCKAVLAGSSLTLGGGPGEVDLLKWAQDPECSGDREDLPFPVSPKLWGSVSVTATECIGGRSCKFGSICHSEIARRGKSTADIIVCNHHYLVLAPAMGGVLLAVDEAHELEEAVRSVYGFNFRAGTGRGFASRLHGVGLSKEAYRVEHLCGDLWADLQERYDDHNRGRRRKEIVKLSPGWLGRMQDNTHEDIAKIGMKVFAIGDSMRFALDEKERERGGMMYRLGQQLIALVQRLDCLGFGEPDAQMQPGPWALWLEDKGRGPAAFATPADVSEAIASVRGRYPRAILASATLATAGTFEHLRASYNMGEPGAAAVMHEEGHVDVHAGPFEEEILPSPFPLHTMGVTVVPQGPSPKSEHWADWATDQIVEAVQYAGGRSLVLCTSYRMMERVHFALRDNTSIPACRQGEMGRTQLIEWFKDRPENTLVATRSFYQGIDVPGDSLSLLVLDKLPFPAFGDPVEEAVTQMLVEREGGSGFMLRSLPQCCTALAQGTGRLIRSATDRGVVLILDSRFSGRKQWQQQVRRSVPPFPVSSDIVDVRRVLRGESPQGAQTSKGAREPRGTARYARGHRRRR